MIIPRLSSLPRIIQTSFTQLYRKSEPDLGTTDDGRRRPEKGPSLYIPKPPAEGCPINSLPPEILSWIFVLGQQTDLDDPDDPDPDLDPYDTDSESDSGSEHDVPAILSVLGDRDPDGVLPLESIPVVDDDQDNSDWEDEDSERNYDSDNYDLSVGTVLVDHSFQVTVSHVCKHWREVALDTPALWSDIHLETGSNATPSYRRASAYLSRSKGHPLSIFIDVDERDDDESVYSEQSDHQPPITSFQLEAILDLLLPHISRWRKFKLAAEDYLYFYTAMSRLSAAPPASLLEYLELHHLEDELEPDRHFFPYTNHKTPFVLFDNNAPKLQHVSLYGVHIDWHNTTFLKNLHHLELAYLPQDVRPSFDDFFAILRSSPGLRSLDLCMSGPFGPPHDWPAFLPPPPLQDDHYHDPHIPASFTAQPHALDEHMVLPRLHELKLSYQTPEELAAFFDRVSMPTLHTLEINFDDFEFTDFIQSRLVAPPKWQGNSSRESRLTNLKELKIIQLPCTPKAIAELYATLVNLETIDLDFTCLDDPFWEVLTGTGVEGVTIPVHQLLPALHTIKVKGLSGDTLRQIVDARIKAELPLRKLFIDFRTDIGKEEDSWLRENVEEVEYFEDSDSDLDDFTGDDESVGSIIDIDIPL